MTLESFHHYCTAMPMVTAEFPFGETVMVFKVAGKMFALAELELFASINLKCDPEMAIELRERYDAVRPGYHMSKLLWNTIIMDGSLSDKLVYEWTKNSYNLIVEKLPKALRESISAQQ